MGYNIDLPQDDVESALRNHFSSCGKITDVCVIVLDDNMLDRFVTTSSSNSTQVLYIYMLTLVFFCFTVLVLFIFSEDKARLTGRCNLVELTLEDGMSLLSLILSWKMQTGKYIDDFDP